MGKVDLNPRLLKKESNRVLVCTRSNSAADLYIMAIRVFVAAMALEGQCFEPDLEQQVLLQ